MFDQLFILLLTFLVGFTVGIPFGVYLHRRWYLWIARHDPANQIQNQDFWTKRQA